MEENKTCRTTTDDNSSNVFRSFSDFYENPTKYWANYECYKNIHWHEPPRRNEKQNEQLADDFDRDVKKASN